MQRRQHPQDAFDHFLSQMPPHVEATFTPQQLDAMRQALVSRQRGRRHPVNIRLSLPGLGHRIYLVLLMGIERRHPERRRRERTQHPLWTGTNLLVIGFAIGTGTLALLGLILASQLEWSSYQQLAHPVGIPFKADPESCEQSDRVWHEGKCIDYEHDPTF